MEVGLLGLMPPIMVQVAVVVRVPLVLQVLQQQVELVVQDCLVL
jgi:hypothetical protein